MEAEVVSEMQDKLPGDTSFEPKLDFAAIRKEGDRRRNEDTSSAWKINWWAVAGVLVSGVLAVTYLWKQHHEEIDLRYGTCAGLSREVEFPLEASAFTLSWGDSMAIRVTAHDSGQLIRQGNLLAIKTGEGLLKLSRTGQETFPDDDNGITITTAFQQQCVVELPDGTRIRLNAKSALQYRDDKRSIALQGEAYVQRNGSSATLTINTDNGYVQTSDGDFVLLSFPRATLAWVRSGALAIRSKNTDEQYLLDCDRQAGILERRSGTDTFGYVHDVDEELALAWTRAVRVYRKVLVRDYMLEMSRWYGYTIKDINCIPKDAKVNARICYRSDVEEVFAVVRNAGIAIYEEGRVLSFCPEEREKRVAYHR